uniref:Cyclic nucleotide-binding domain-containing protein n=2 Tax=Vitrella brassicaformis TaxID=1169539 RepID=A0A7S1KDZ0_9ALVE
MEIGTIFLWSCGMYVEFRAFYTRFRLLRKQEALNLNAHSFRALSIILAKLSLANLQKDTAHETPLAIGFFQRWAAEHMERLLDRGWGHGAPPEADKAVRQDSSLSESEEDQHKPSFVQRFFTASGTTKTPSFCAASKRSSVFRRMYYRRFVRDLLTIVPFALVFDLASRGEGGRWDNESFENTLSIILPLCRLFMVFRLPELVYHLLVTAKFDVSLFRIVEILFFYLSTLHVFACLFIRLAEDRNDELASWYIRLPVIAKPASPSPDDPCCYGIGRPGFPSPPPLSERSIYVHAIYWSFNTGSHIGTGDVTPVTTQEKVFTVIMIAIMTFLYAAFFGNIVSLVSDLGPKLRQPIAKALRQAKEVAGVGGIAQTFIDELQSYFHYSWQASRGLDEALLLREIPDALRTDILQFLYRRIIYASGFFRGPDGRTDWALVNSTLRCLQFRVCMEGDFIIRKGDVSDEMFFLLDGLCEDNDMSNVQANVDEDLSPYRIQIEDVKARTARMGTTVGYTYDYNDTRPPLVPQSNFNTRPSYMRKASGAATTLLGRKNTIRPGQHFGAVGLFSNTERTADVMATSICRVGVLHRSHFRALTRAYPHLDEYLGRLVKETKAEAEALNDQLASDDATPVTPVDKTPEQRKPSPPKRRVSLAPDLPDSKDNPFMLPSEPQDDKHEDASSMKADRSPQAAGPLKKESASPLRRWNTRSQHGSSSPTGRGAASMLYQGSLMHFSGTFAQAFTKTGLIFMPESKTRLAIYSVHFIAIFCMLFVYPFVTAFKVSQLEVFSIIVFALLDIECLVFFLLNCRTAFYKHGAEGGEFTLRPSAMLSHYWEHGGGKFDALAAIPLLWMMGDAKWYFVFLRLLRLVVVFRLPAIFIELERRVHFFAYHGQLLSAVLSLTLLWHFSSCIWYSVGRETNGSWLDAYGLAHSDDREWSDLFQQVVASFYYTMVIVTSVGYGDIIPQTDRERIVATTLIVVGDALFAVAFGSVSAAVQNSNIEQSQLSDRFNTIRNKMRFDGIPSSILTRTEFFFSYYWQQVLDHKYGVIGLTQSNLAASVPPLLYRKFLLQYHRRFFDRVPMFRDQPDHFLSLVVSHLVCRVYMPADYICVKGDYGDEMYFIEEGKVLIYSTDESSILHSLGPGDFFGELSLMRGQMRSCSVQADSFCLVLVLKKQHLDRILQAFPKIASELHSVADARQIIARVQSRLNEDYVLNFDNLPVSLVAKYHSRQPVKR